MGCPWPRAPYGTAACPLTHAHTITRPSYAVLPRGLAARPFRAQLSRGEDTLFPSAQRPHMSEVNSSAAPQFDKR
eukprot:1666357-Pyramimonas_sp.AAC.1